MTVPDIVPTTTGPATAAAVALAGQAAAEPADALAADLAPSAPSIGLDITRLRRLSALRARHAIAETQAKELARQIEKVNREVVLHVTEATEQDLAEGWSMTVGAETAHAVTRIFPVYRAREVAGAGEDAEAVAEKFAMPDLLAALRDSGADELVALIAETVNGNAWNSAVSRMVKAWRARLDESGPPVDGEGEPVDAFGNVLTDDERDDPAADVLGLPPAVRAIVGVSSSTAIKFRQR